MLGSKITRVLPGKVRRMTLLRAPLPGSTRYQKSTGPTQSLSTFISSPLMVSVERDERKKGFVLPAINVQQPLSLPIRSFSSAATNEKETFRERMEGRKEQGIVAMGNAKDLFKRYGPVFVGTYFTIYFSTLGLLFTGIESGVLDPAYILSLVSDNADEAKSTVQIIVDFMENHTMTRPWASYVQRNPEVANLAVAWITTKFTEPIRLVISAAVVPKVARTLGYGEKIDEEERKKE